VNDEDDDDANLMRYLERIVNELQRLIIEN